MYQCHTQLNNVYRLVFPSKWILHWVLIGILFSWHSHKQTITSTPSFTCTAVRVFVQVCCIRVGTRLMYCCLARWIFVFVGISFFFTLKQQITSPLKHSGQTTRIVSNAFHFRSVQRMSSTLVATAEHFSFKVTQKKQTTSHFNCTAIVYWKRQNCILEKT